MSTILVLLVILLFTSDLVQPSESKGQCEVDSLSEYLNHYLSLPYQCDEIYITNTTEVLTSSKLKKATNLITSIKIIGGVSGIQKSCFKYKSGITNITIAGNNLPTFSTFTFSGLSLIELNLTNNRIVDLGLNPFGNSAIKILDLSYNKISTLLKSSFSSPFLDINISRNRLSYIESQCFNSDLQFLNLEYNSLYYVSKDHFSNLRNLRELYLGNNRLVDVDFSDNNLDRLEILDLSYNQIKSLHRIAFSSFLNLKYLNVSRNQIKWMSSTTLQIFANLETLDISLNYLTSFPYSNLPNSIVNFNTIGNPWNCKCFFHMEKYLLYNKVIFNCDYVSNHDVPFCISYRETCNNRANDTLVAAFVENISTKLTTYCNGSAPGRSKIKPIYPIQTRPFSAPIRKHQVK